MIVCIVKTSAFLFVFFGLGRLKKKKEKVVPRVPSGSFSSSHLINALLSSREKVPF